MLEGGIVHSTDGVNKQKDRERENLFSLFDWAATSILSCPWTSALPILRPSDSDWITPPALLGLQFADSRWWDLSAFIIT